MQQIAPNLFCFTGLIAGRVYLIEDSDGLTLIDASIGPSAAKILKQLTAAGYQPGDVKRILITHGHPDHVGGLPAIQAATGAQVIASTIERPVIEGKEPIPRPERATATGLARMGLRPPSTTVKPTPVAREVNDGDMLPEVFGGMQVIALPGHAPGQIGFWQPEQRLLICGDAIMRLWGQVRLPLSFLTHDMAEAKRSIAKIAALDIALLCFGHGDPLTENIKHTVSGLI